MAHRDKLAVNPLPWVLSEGGFRLDEETLTAAMQDLAEAGFDALHADIPQGWTVDQYLQLLNSNGFRPAPGYFGAMWSDRAQHAELVEQAKRHAAVLAALGLTECFIASNLTEARLATPAQGVDPDSDRTAAVADGLAAAADAGKAEGITYALHPHVGSEVEVEEEIRQVLDATAGSALAFGPDTGHLAWAGTDPAILVRDYANRVVALHVKDLDAGAAADAKAANAGYWAATGVHHVWTEPGRGSVDFAAVFAALPTAFDGWSVLEVDVPNLPTPLESARVSRENLLAMPFFTQNSELSA